MNDLDVYVDAHTDDAVEDINELKAALENLSDTVDRLEAKGIEVQITASTNDDD